MARIYAVRLAWPIFARALRSWFALGGSFDKPRRGEAWVPRRPINVPLDGSGATAPPPMHRAFEWTPGADGLGHPHFHLWTICPFVPKSAIERMWLDALHTVGVRNSDGSPLEHVRVSIQAFKDFDRAAVGELVKAGNRKAIEASRLYKHGPANAFEYADGWTIADAMRDCPPDVVASLYMALEGARLTQASRGFFLDDEPPACDTCKAQGCWHVRFEKAPEAPEVEHDRIYPEDAAFSLRERAPP